MSSPVLIKVAPEERRTERRIIYCDRVNVTLFNSDGLPTYVENVECIEVSKHGIRLALSVRIPAGNLIVVSASKPDLKASNAAFQVAWCELRDGAYQIGGRLISPTDNWNVLTA
jgi:hypothetical protein